jgi:hypothetical protein
VYVQDAIGPQGYPNFGADLHCATLDLQTKLGHVIPIRESERVRQATDRGDERALAYMQEGSFARWLIESEGLDKFLDLLKGHDAMTVYGRDWQRLESDWRAMLSSPAAAANCLTKAPH